MTELASPRVTIIGAGPAGLMAADVLSAAGLAVTIHERMPSPARKFLMAGRGGLNLTHAEPLADFLARYGPAAKWLAPEIEAFSPSALREWAKSLGQETFVGTSDRVFPTAMKASPLLRALLVRLGERGAVLVTRSTWRGFAADGGLLLEDAAGERRQMPADATLLALGGASWPRLGSDGAWVDILRARGVEITPLAPTNVGVTLAWSEHFRERFAGQPLKRLTATFAGRVAPGEAVVTRTGLEGGAIYALSRPLSAALERGERPLLRLDLRPDHEHAALARHLAAARKGESLSNRLRKLGLSPPAIGLLREATGNAPPTAPDALAALVKACPLEVTGLAGLERAISSAGGIRFSEIDEHFMLRALPGVFVAGEMLDWEAPTGGYLLQATFSTAVAAARGILARLGRV